MGDRKPKSKKPSDLNESDFLGIVMQLVIKVDNKGLSDIQKILVNGFRQDLTYAEIAEKNYLNSENLRKEANKKLFPLISKALTEAMKTPIEVQKTNFITLIEHWNAIDNKGISVENSFVKSKTKIDIFTELKNNLSGQQKSELNRIIKSYLPDNDNANFEKIIDKIIDSPDKDSLIILFRLTQDSRVNSSTCSKIEQTIQDLKELLKITDTDYNAWTGEITEINPEPDNRENINNYLIIKIEESKGQANTYHEYKFAAWFLQLNTSQSQGNNYIPLPVDSSVSKDVYTQKDITNILTKIIEDCHERGGANLNIEFFTDGKLLYTNFESWEYNCFDSLTQLKRVYFVNVRSLMRLEKMYSKMPAYQNWKSRWERLTTNSIDTQTVNNSESYLCQETTLWSNLCASTQEDLEQFFKRSLKYGIPLAVGSRCHAQEASHRTEINTLLQGIQINQLSTKVQEVRRQSPDNLEDEPEHLGHHLLCFLEDPNRMPPFHYLTSQHLG
ncbi:Genome sequencing data, contig C298 [Microcystis aeruginosa PCC 9432]|jgi:hypothetical protein|uniref:Genome sequencing data, contig C298 n=1 Tax=Microcystis aeruginosa PCC 9432 TaxID=1160280 RepID=A0A822LEV9_MICAE|nr:hypothetical protein [Microcystis aeruginosa]TRT91318.1 MAG: hypothetical protein EWV62_23875 [Microcystis aeruginosa Ma_OC_LR_19540900_S633]CCH93849.1 Genome sequencing data, contig C298 [Microcystis aeruginosa PCC 9432]